MALESQRLMIRRRRKQTKGQTGGREGGGLYHDRVEFNRMIYIKEADSGTRLEEVLKCRRSLKEKDGDPISIGESEIEGKRISGKERVKVSRKT